MLLLELPLKVKIIVFAVLALLVLSVVGTTLQAVDQVARDASAVTQADGSQLVGQIDNAGDTDDTAAVKSFKFVCPFH